MIRTVGVIEITKPDLLQDYSTQIDLLKPGRHIITAFWMLIGYQVSVYGSDDQVQMDLNRNTIPIFCKPYRHIIIMPEISPDNRLRLVFDTIQVPVSC